jgi:DNA-binding HxlR family transcriptional regulator
LTNEASVTDPREARQDSEVRKVSKKLFGSQYRVEIAQAIASLDPGWSTRDLEERFPNRLDLPWSCIAKEINALLELRFIKRTNGKTLDGRKTYSKTDHLPSFWQVIHDIAAELGKGAGSEESDNVRVLRPRGAKRGS